jgi:hypothetical protein
LEIPDGYTVDIVSVDGAASMTEGYNSAMSSNNAKYKVYLHQDVLIINRKFIFDILEIFKRNNKIGMIGIAGSKVIAKDGSPWVDSSQGRIGEAYQDVIYKNAHSMYDKAKVPYEEVPVIDGLLMATQYDLPWRDDLFKGWDFYDCSQSMEFIKAGYKVVVPYMDKPWCFHDNDVLNMSNYNKWKQIFAAEYKDIYYRWTKDYIENNQSVISEVRLGADFNIDGRKITMIIPMNNQSLENKKCIESIKEHCDIEKLNIVVIDNNSDEDEGKWARNQDCLTYVNFTGNQAGYAKMINETIKALDIKGDFMVLDSTFYMVDDLISKIKNTVDRKAAIGTVAPLFSCDIYRKLFRAEIDENIAANYESNIYETLVSHPYAVYIRWNCWENSGGFCDKFESPYLVIMDFQLRALKNGYQNVIQLDAFINNMSTMGVLNDISEIDTGVFYEKWGVQYLKSRPNKIMYENILENRNRQIANILEIGCGCGENLLILKNLFPNASLYGVDINPSAVSISSNIANVVCMDIEKDEVPFKGMKFDLIIFDNVLQHFVFPKDVLAKCRGYLDDVGLVISVIPNIQHISILKELIYGKFTYSGNELLEKNNYHLFTGQEILKIFPEAGYLVLKISYFSGYNTLEEIETYDKLMKAFPEVTDFEMNALYYIVKARKCD